MTYFLNPVEQERCLFITCEGEMRISEVVEVHQQVKAVLAASPFRHVLLDFTQANYISTALELFYFAAALPSDLPPDARIALIVRPDQVKHANLLETVAQYGGRSLTSFVDLERAEAWVRDVNAPVTSSGTAIPPTNSDN